MPAAGSGYIKNGHIFHRKPWGLGRRLPLRSLPGRGSRAVGLGLKRWHPGLATWPRAAPNAKVPLQALCLPGCLWSKGYEARGLLGAQSWMGKFHDLA